MDYGGWIYPPDQSILGESWLLASFLFVQKRSVQTINPTMYVRIVFGCFSHGIAIADRLPKKADTPYMQQSVPETFYEFLPRVPKAQLPKENTIQEHKRNPSLAPVPTQKVSNEAILTGLKGHTCVVCAHTCVACAYTCVISAKSFPVCARIPASCLPRASSRLHRKSFLVCARIPASCLPRASSRLHRKRFLGDLAARNESSLHGRIRVTPALLKNGRSPIIGDRPFFNKAGVTRILPCSELSLRAARSPRNLFLCRREEALGRHDAGIRAQTRKLFAEMTQVYAQSTQVCAQATQVCAQMTQITMGRKLRHLLIFLLIILKEPNMQEAEPCSCKPSPYCRLQDLNLFNNQIATIHSGAFENLPLLKRLNIAHNKMSAIPLSVFCLFPSNITIELDGNPWQCDWLNPNVGGGGNTNTAASVLAGGGDHQNEDIDNFRVKTGQGRANIQSLNIGNRHNKVLAALKPNDMYAGEGTTAGSVMASVDDHQYEDIDKPRVKTGQGQSRAITESNTNTTDTVVVTGDDHQYEDIDNHHVKSQSITESNTNTTATVHVVVTGHDQTGQGQSQTNTESLDARNLSYATGPTAAQLNSLYKTATEMVTGDDQTGQSQYEAHTEPLDARNASYGTRPTAAQLNSMYKTATEMVTGDDQTGQGQFQANTESLGARNLSYATGSTAAQLNSMYKTATEMVSGDDQTGQSQFQANTESLGARNLSYATGSTAAQLNSMYKTATEMASGDG
ncbi:hypothetical protein Bbelb_370810 [Branchiostoma belcheri]|nr:hypothetical protein Bbelb_370810 [Branchiostoma belcheri]